MKVRRLAVVGAAVGLATLVVSTAAALAQPPAKAGWWNAASAGGAAAPLPTTAAGDLHVGQGPAGPTAIAAVSYDVFGVVSNAVLELKLTSGTAVGTPALHACVTKDNAWKAQEDGPMSDAPAYDCASNAVPGLPSADG